MIKAASDPTVNSPLFAHDLVDLTRQTVQLAIGLLYRKLVNQYNSGDQEGFNSTVPTFIQLLDDLDAVLKTNKKFLLGPWLEDAKTAAKTANESEQFEWNARNQVNPFPDKLIALVDNGF